jgi:cytochrome b561
MIVLFMLGYYMTDLSYMDLYYNLSYNIHKSLGILAFELSVAMILWTLYCKIPQPLASHKNWEQIAARLAHITLFIMMVLIPFSGYAISSSGGKAVSFFDWYAIPSFLPIREGLEDFAGEVHYYLAYGTLLLVCIHIAAALKHQFIDKDGTISRMLGRPAE